MPTENINDPIDQVNLEGTWLSLEKSNHLGRDCPGQRENDGHIAETQGISLCNAATGPFETEYDERGSDQTLKGETRATWVTIMGGGAALY